MINEAFLDNMLLSLGHDDFNRGTAYLREGVKLWDAGIQSMTKGVYLDVAKAHGSTASRVERCMRHSIEKAWARGDEVAQLRTFGYSVDPTMGRPTVGEYIARLARVCREN